MDTFGGRVHVEWDPDAAVTALGQLSFFIEYLRLGDLFDPLVADCPVVMTSPNAPAKRDVLGTLLLSVLSGHKRYAHIIGLRGDGVNPENGGAKIVHGSGRMPPWPRRRKTLPPFSLRSLWKDGRREDVQVSSD